jgi:hypothetical protein
VLFEYLGSMAKTICPGLEDVDAIVDDIDMQQMQDDLLNMLNHDQVMRLYNMGDFGRGCLAGAYFTSYVLPQLVLDEES